MSEVAITITLGGADYSVPLLSVDQVERYLAQVKANEDARKAGGDYVANFKGMIENAAILLSDATPAIGDIRSLRVTPPQLADAIRQILTFGGLQEDKPEAPAAGEAPAAPAPAPAAA